MLLSGLSSDTQFNTLKLTLTVLQEQYCDDFYCKFPCTDKCSLRESDKRFSTSGFFRN